jgi:UDP-N-acetylglucosamine 2-epimerase (non-hydrolysing)
MASEKVLVIFGTRPEAIKMSPVILSLRELGIKTEVCVTGQHREMLDQALDIFKIKPEHDLKIMRPGQSLTDVTVAVISQLAPIFAATKPSSVLVHGDTTTAFASSIAAFYSKIPIGHIEAGLRTNDKYNPFPEEMNRKLIGSLADLNFCPTDNARINLLREGVDQEKILVTGNTGIDAVRLITNEMQNSYPEKKLDEHDFRGKYILVTAHRRESFGKGMVNLCEALKLIAQKYQDFTIIVTVHPNPEVQKVFNQMLANVNGVRIIPPQNYSTFVELMANSYIIMTDSGGIQEEAPFFKKPILVLRETTERPEGIDAGCAILVGTNPSSIIHQVSRLINDEAYYRSFAKTNNPYGDGFAAERIAKSIFNWV